ncbi:hypothetical protein PC120_g28036 [Phytophthora cactorum]|nr:hypothetical protein PC120_g28036 [Phytophthora cactorum]
MPRSTASWPCGERPAIFHSTDALDVGIVSSTRRAEERRGCVLHHAMLVSPRARRTVCCRWIPLQVVTTAKLDTRHGRRQRMEADFGISLCGCCTAGSGLWGYQRVWCVAWRAVAVKTNVGSAVYDAESVRWK